MAASDKEFDTEVAKSLCFVNALLGVAITLYNTATLVYGISIMIGGAYLAGLFLVICVPFAYPMVRHFYKRWRFFRKQVKYLTQGE